MTSGSLFRCRCSAALLSRGSLRSGSSAFDAEEAHTFFYFILFYFCFASTEWPLQRTVQMFLPLGLYVCLRIQKFISVLLYKRRGKSKDK
eukprot:gene7503-5288_t